MIRTLYIARCIINDRPFDFAVLTKQPKRPIIISDHRGLTIIFGKNSPDDGLICDMWHLEKLIPNIAPKGGEVVKVEFEETEDGYIIRRVEL